MFNRPAGVILVTLNHNGDRMSANKALRKAAKAGINVQEIVVHDDIAQGIATPEDDKRGLGGSIALIKVMGAAAEEGKSIDEIMEIGNKFNAGIATLSVALKVATHPQNGGDIGAIDDDKMEVGMGQHGEGGGGIMPVKSADETAELMVTRLMAASGVQSGDKAFLVINGSGATTLMEMLVVYRKAKQVLEAAGVTVVPGKCTEWLTVQEMAGFQMILCKCCDTCAKYLAAPSDAPYWVTK
jgi:dihydroxyacetone kinase-like protein